MKTWLHRRVRSVFPRRFGAVRRCTSIRPDEVEFMEVESSSTGNSSTSGSKAPMFEDVTHIDSFARARVVNFAKRYHSAAANGGNALFETKRIRTADGELFHAQLSFSVPSPSDGLERLHLRGEGIATTLKEAEILAAMHAERSIDANGLSIYTLPSMQRRHAEAARSAGRWAPMPDDAARGVVAPPDVPLPTALRRVGHSDESELGEWLLVDTSVAQFRQHPYAITSRCILDVASLHRIKSLFATQMYSFDQHLAVTDALEPKTNERWYTAVISAPRGVTMLNQTTSQSVRGEGKSTDRQTAVTLAAMHLELTLDALGACLFPADPASQRLHALAARKFGRTAPLEAGETAIVDSHGNAAVLPVRLKQLVVSSTSGPRKSARSAEEEWVRCHIALTKETVSFREPSAKERDGSNGGEAAKELVQSYLRRKRFPEHCLFEQVGLATKATVVLSVPSEYGVRGGVGLAPTTAEAEALAWMHAVDVLCALGIELYETRAQQEAFLTQRRNDGLIVSLAESRVAFATPSPPALRRLPPSGSPLSGAPTSLEGLGSVGGNASTTTTTTTTADPSGSDQGAVHQSSSPSHSLNAHTAKLPQHSTSSTSVPNPVEFRSEANRKCWDLTEDFQDYIVVHDRLKIPGVDESGGNDDLAPLGRHTLLSPRLLDPRARERVIAYFADLGKRLVDNMVVAAVDFSPRSEPTSYRVTITLPLPAAFGNRAAMGVAAKSYDAEILACMHAELTLDALGIPIFTLPSYQEQHTLAAMRFGRFAPMPGQSPKPFGTPSPPFLKKPTADELSWIDMVRNRRGKEAETAGTTAHRQKNTPAGTTDPSPPAPQQQPAAVAGTTNAAVAKAMLPSRIEYLRPEQLDPVSKPRVQYYLRRMRASDAVHITMCQTSDGNPHVATLPVPVPSRFGDRKAVGVAPSQRSAEVLCFMHAERILDALGIPIFNLPGMQTRHAQRVAVLGRWAPMLSEQVVMPAGTPSPLPLGLGETIAASPVPRRPSREDVEARSDAWKNYVLACELYIESVEKRHANHHFENERVPRVGDAVLDEALDEAERAEVNQDVKHVLTRYCNAMNLRFPTYWRSRLVGPTQKRVCLTTVEVPGWEHVLANGVALSKENSHRRAAMHICSILRRIEPDFVAFEKQMQLQSSGNFGASSSTTKVNPRMASSWDTVRKSFTAEGKIRTIDLYTICFGLPPPVVLNKQRLHNNSTSDGSSSSASSAASSWVTTVEVVDEDGRQWVGRGDDAGRKGNATAAYDDLFGQLQDGAPGFQSVAELVQGHPHLNPEQIMDISFPPHVKDSIRQLVGDTATTAALDSDDIDEPVAIIDRDYAHDATTSSLRKTLATSIEQQEVRHQSDELQRKLMQKLLSVNYQEKFAAKRQSLSIHQHKAAILSAIAKNPVVIICGTTGCGKTTQVPQYIMDDATERGVGGEVSIVVTQPRRLSAVSIAQRIASERLEGIGEVCGYTIRLDSKPGRHINFLTAGVLLRLFHASPTLEGINYVIIDEIHERDINSDFLLILVRDLVRRRKDLRVVLMSATLSSEQFAEYFSGAPVINVIGYVHPVEELFLTDLAQAAEKRTRLTPLLTEALAEHKKNQDMKYVKEAVLQTAYFDDNDDDLDESRIMLKASNSAGAATNGTSVAAPSPSANSKKYGFLEATGEIDYLAIQFAVEYALGQLVIAESSVLVFLPGWEEIVKAKEILSRSSSKYHIITLHSSISSAEQLLCFQPPPPGKVKLILSTNIAESGVTIDDVAVVVDVGRAKEKSYILRRGRTQYGRNEMGSMSQLVTVFASRANCVQRRGRVGRTRPGICIRMYTKEHFDSVHDFQTPEMLRQPLDALCLQILALDLGDPVDFLQQAVEPPTAVQIESAMRRLHELGAVTRRGLLTPLGKYLAQLPLAPRVGKMVLVGAVLKCLDSALTIAACSDTDVFTTSREAKEAVRMHREDLSANTLSDHIASVNGFNQWVTAHNTKTPQEVMNFLQERMLSVPQLLTVSRYKRQFFDILCQHRFLPEAAQILRDRSRDPHCQGDIFVEKSAYSADKTHVGLVKSVIGSGLFPNICLSRGGKKVFRSKLENRLAPASASVVAMQTVTSADEAATASPFFVYDEIIQQSLDPKVTRCVMRGLTSVPIWSVLLLGTSSMPVTYREDLNLGIIDDWILFRASFSDLDLTRKFKKEFHRCLTRKFTAPDDRSNNAKLDQFQKVIRELTNASIKPNELSTATWRETGTISEPLLSVTAQSESEVVGDTSDNVGEHPHVDPDNND